MVDIGTKSLYTLVVRERVANLAVFGIGYDVPVQGFAMPVFTTNITV